MNAKVWIYSGVLKLEKECEAEKLPVKASLVVPGVVVVRPPNWSFLAITDRKIFRLGFLIFHRVIHSS